MTVEIPVRIAARLFSFNPPTGGNRLSPPRGWRGAPRRAFRTPQPSLPQGQDRECKREEEKNLAVTMFMAADGDKWLNSRTTSEQPVNHVQLTDRHDNPD